MKCLYVMLWSVGAFSSSSVEFAATVSTMAEDRFSGVWKGLATGENNPLVELTSEAYFAGRDPVLEQVLGGIGSSTSPVEGAKGDTPKIGEGAAFEVERSIHIETSFAVPRATLWEAWSTSRGLESFMFMAPKARVDLRLGGKYEFYAFPDKPEGEQGNEGCTVLSFVPGEMLSFTWNAPSWFDPILRKTFTFVVLRFESSSDETTRLTLDHLGFPEEEDWDEKWDELLAFFERGWRVVLRSLEESLSGDASE